MSGILQWINEGKEQEEGPFAESSTFLLVSAETKKEIKHILTDKYKV